jgi:hypothetical protein
LWQLHAYMLTSESAEKLLSYLPISEPVDNFIARLIHSGAIQVTVTYII